MAKRIINNKKQKGTLVLLILDGWGVAPPSIGNAIALAHTPVLKSILKKYPHTTLQASGRYVGLPDGQPGNSEAGHMNLGAGRIVEQDSVKISKAINQGLFFKNSVFLRAIEHVHQHQSSLHIMGLLTQQRSGHADPDHLLALISLARIYRVHNVYLHLFTDGRDSPPYSALKLVEAFIRVLKGELIASVIGRFYAMDRNKYWSRTMLAYDALVLGSGLKARSPQAAITECYNRKQTDEFISPYVITRDNRNIPRINDHDSIIFFNLRSDRARQLTKAFVQKDFEKLNPGSFHRKKMLRNIFFVAMTDFGPDLENVWTAYPSEGLFDTLPMVLKHQRQLYIAESEKFPHVSYFFNGGYATPVNDEKRIKILSPDVRIYDRVPEMSIYKITRYVIKNIKRYDFIVINFANPDMIGHTGNIQAGIRAAQIVDECIGKIKNSVLRNQGILIITSDHGNLEKMVNLDTNEIFTEHTLNPVPCILISKKRYKLKKSTNFPLSAVTPTILKIFGIKKPNSMSTKDLLK